MEGRSCLCNITPEQLTYLATTVATVLSEEFSTDEVFVLSSFFSSVGSALGLVARHKSFVKDDCTTPKTETNSTS